MYKKCFVVVIVSIDLKRLYWQAGVDNKTSVFIFNDTQVVEEGFLEDINNVLSSGEVPNLYKPDEFEEVYKCILTVVWGSITARISQAEITVITSHV